MNWIHPITLILGAVLVVFAESTVTSLRHIVGAQPDLLPPLVVYAALHASLSTTATTAILGGLMLDALSTGPLGVSAIPLVLLGVLLHRRRDVLLRDSTWAQVLLGGIGSAGVCALTMTLLYLLWPLVAGGESVMPFWPERREGLLTLPAVGLGFLWQLAVVGITGAAATPLIFGVFRWVERTFHYQPIQRPSYRTDREIQRGRR
jgi:rod shape-determining protein MreD